MTTIEKPHLVMESYDSGDSDPDDIYGDDEIGDFSSEDDSENYEEELSQLSELSFEPSREIESDDDNTGCCHWSRDHPENYVIAIEPFSIDLMGRNSREFADTTTPGIF